MKLSYSEYKTYLECPKKYHLEVTNTEPPAEQSKYFAMYGLLVEMFFKLYVNTILKRKLVLSDDQIHKILRKLWDKIINENYVVWDDPWCRESSEHIFMSAHEDIIANINEFELWGYTKSEIAFDILLKKTQDTLSCRLDFIVNNPDGTIEILDGKGTYKIDKPMDMEQLYFYILIYLLHYKKLPDKAGFLFYRFKVICYIDFDLKTIIDFKDKLILVKNAIKKDTKFEAKVGISKHCKWCAYNLNCEELAIKKKEWADKRKKKKPEEPFDYNGEILSFSMKGICDDEGSD
jgi:hypothetical protein